jgi:hypothetical protein
VRRLSRFLCLLPLTLAATSCFEPPVAESLLLEFLPEGLVTITAQTRIRDLDESNPALQRRIADARRAAVEGTDAWSRRFEALGPIVERGRWEKHDDRLVLWEHGATTDDPEALGRFFADTGLAVEWRRSDGRNELTLYPPAGGAATRQERQQVARSLASWSTRIAAYLQRAGELRAYLDGHPDRERPCLARVFSAYLPDEDVAATGPLSSEEDHLVHRLEDAMHEATSILEIPAGEAYSIDEMSRHVYDPFPAPLEIALPGPALESEGFAIDTNEGRSHLRAGGTSLWQALRGLENHWIAPDPMLAIVEYDLRASHDQPFDLAGFLSHDRQAPQSPTAQQVKDALTARLEPPTTYRVTWLDPNPPTADGDEPR